MAIQVRVTQQSIGARVMSGLQNNLFKMGRLQEQLSSGKLITRPSDSPTGTVSSMQLRGEIRALDQYSRNADDGLGWLSTIDTTLTSGLAQVNKVRDLTLQGMSAGAAGSPEARAAIATEIDNIRESLISMSNTRYLDRPIFGGVTAGGTAYLPDGSYQGTVVDPTADSTKVMRTVGNGTKVRVDLSGPEAFGADGDPIPNPTQLFTVLNRISANLASGNTTGLQEDLANLDTARIRLQTTVSDIGARYNRVEQTRQTADDRTLTLRSQLSEVEDIDLPQTIMNLKLQETAYESSLAATARVIQPSLMDYLR